LSNTAPQKEHPENLCLTVVIPAKNEAHMIEDTLLTINDILCRNHLAAEIIVVDDGSTDNTSAEVIRTGTRLQFPLKIVRQNRSQGKGAALMTGFALSRADYVAFIDADLEYPAEEIPRMLVRLQAHPLEACAIAVRQTDTRPVWERLTSLIAHKIASLCLQVPVRDTQAGLKMFPGWFARQVLSAAEETGWLFDLEALSKATLYQLPIIQFPVQQTARRPRRARVSAMIGCLPALWRLTKNHWTAGNRGRLLRFIGVGSFNTGVDLTLYFLLISLFPPHHQWWLAAAESFASWSMTSLLSRRLHSRITFGRNLQPTGFYAITLLGILVQVGMSALLSHMAGSVGAFMGKLGGIIIAAGITYTGYLWLAQRSAPVSGTHDLAFSPPRTIDTRAETDI